jgi:hypothetical protein
MTSKAISFPAPYAMANPNPKPKPQPLKRHCSGRGCHRAPLNSAKVKHYALRTWLHSIQYVCDMCALKWICEMRALISSRECKALDTGVADEMQR